MDVNENLFLFLLLSLSRLISCLSFSSKYLREKQEKENDFRECHGESLSFFYVLMFSALSTAKIEKVLFFGREKCENVH